MNPLHNIAAPKPLVVGIGEVLFDCFPDREVLGGAPFNVAIHADAILGPRGGAGLPVTRVGADDHGDRILTESRSRGLDTRYIQSDGVRPTGRVAVRLDAQGHATYEFDADSAWDHLRYDEDLAALAGRCDAIAFGTLGQRSPQSRETIARFLSHAPQAQRLFDVNLRQSYFDAAMIDLSLRMATAAKFNEEEIIAVPDLLGLQVGPSVDDRAHAIAEIYSLVWVAVTRGERGAAIYLDGEKHETMPAPFRPVADADTVGAGDACCAGLLCGALLDMSIEQTLWLANRLGAYVAGRPGATPELPKDLIDVVASHRRSVKTR
jgi:fructokinase